MRTFDRSKQDSGAEPRVLALGSPMILNRRTVDKHKRKSDFASVAHVPSCHHVY